MYQLLGVVDFSLKATKITEKQRALYSLLVYAFGAKLCFVPSLRHGIVVFGACCRCFTLVVRGRILFLRFATRGFSRGFPG